MSATMAEASPAGKPADPRLSNHHRPRTVQPSLGSMRCDVGGAPSIRARPERLRSGRTAVRLSGGQEPRRVLTRPSSRRAWARRSRSRWERRSPASSNGASGCRRCFAPWTAGGSSRVGERSRCCPEQRSGGSGRLEVDHGRSSGAARRDGLSGEAGVLHLRTAAPGSLGRVDLTARCRSRCRPGCRSRSCRFSFSSRDGDVGSPPGRRTQSVGAGAGDSATQMTPVLPSWSASTVSDGESLSSTTLPPAATTAAMRCSPTSSGT